jgi:hypothetical protein
MMYNPPDAAMTDGVIDFLEQLSAANTTTNSVRSPFHSTHTPPMTIRLYCERIVKYSKCTPEAFVVGMLLLCKFTVFSQHPITVFNVHRMLITSTLIAAKMRDDEYYANTYYARIGGITSDELNALEVHFLSILSWDMWIGEDEFECAVAMLLTVHDAVVSGSIPLAHEVWTSWLQSFEQQSKLRHARVSDTLARDIAREAALARSPSTPGTPDDFNMPRRRQAAPFRARGSRGTPQGCIPSSQSGVGFPSAPSQQSIGHCESNVSVDNSKPEGNPAAQHGESSRDNSGSLGPDASTEHSPRELAPTTQMTSGTSNRSWANVARTKPGQLNECGSTEQHASPCTPTSQNDSSVSSQQVTPTRTMTKQRFSGSTKNTPTSVRRHTDPVQSFRSSNVTPQVQLVPEGGVSTPSASTPSSASPGKANKKRPKPEQFQDYR